MYFGKQNYKKSMYGYIYDIALDKMLFSIQKYWYFHENIF